MKRKILCLILALAGCIAGAAVSEYANPALNPVKFQKAPVHPALTLLKNGRLNFVITGNFAQDKKAEYRDWRSVTLAGEALADAFERTTGSRPELVQDGTPEALNAPMVIALGETTFSRKLGLKPLELPKEAFLVQSFPRGVVIAGHDGSLIPGSYNKMDWSRYRLNGTLNGVYDFIERFLDVRFYYPGLGISAPSLKDLTVRPVAYRDEPYFHNRYNYAWILEFHRKWPWPGIKHENKFDNAWRLAMSTRCIEACHTPEPHRLLKAFPDKKNVIFFTDKAGFTYYNPATHIGNLFDVTNPEFAELMIGAYRKFYATDGKWNAPWKGWYPPNSEYVLFGQSDTYVRELKNEKTKHLFPASRPDNIVSDLYMNFYIQLAKGLKQHLPGKRLSVLAYHNYTLPPIVCTDIPDIIDVQVCEGRLVMAKSLETQKHWEKLFHDWFKVLGGRKVSAWTYGAQNNQFTQAIQGRYTRDFIQLLKPYLSRDGFFIDAGGLRWHYYYSYYLSYRSLWNPDFNIEAALEEHWPRLYGEKAGACLREFYKILVDRWENVYIAELNRKKIHESNATPARLYNAYNLPVVQKLEKLLKQALDATAPGSLERLRVEYFAKPWAAEFTSARAYCTQVTPVYKVRRLPPGEEIVVDGKLDEKAWSRAFAMEMKDAKGSGRPVVTSPDGRMLWNERGLYISFTCKGKPQLNKGDLWFNSDNIELFLSPGTEKATYYQFAVNPTNDWHDAYKVEKPMEAALDSKWSAEGVRHATVAAADSWTTEIFIPFAALHRQKAPRPYSSWFANLVNNKLDADKKCAEYSSFAMTMGNNHNHALWGKIKFLGKGD